MTETWTIAQATPDGYNLLFTASGPLVINKVLVKNLAYDLERDFEPISLVAVLPNIFAVSSKLTMTSVSEFMAYAKSRGEPHHL